MGHKGGIEFDYTFGKGLMDVVEKMSEGYAKAAERYLVTTRKEGVTETKVIETFNRQFLTMAGYTNEEIAEMGDLSQLLAEDMQELVRKKAEAMLGLGNNHQKIIHKDNLKHHIQSGWEFVHTISDSEVIVRLPKN